MTASHTSSNLPRDVVVRLYGGLGNQLFQYAAARALAARRGCPLRLDLSAFRHDRLRAYALAPYHLDATPIDAHTGHRHARLLKEMPPHVQLIGRLDRLLSSRWLRPMVIEQGHWFHPEVVHTQPPCYLAGYWQSEKYFADSRDLLLSELAVREPLAGANAAMAQDITSHDAISLHVRRGDYLTDANASRFHGLCSPAFYEAALDRILPHCARPAVFVFSDDPAWAKQHIHTPVRTVYVDQNGDDRNYEDLRLMSLCTHNITANSSFSWWGAWLGTQPGKIVCVPRVWFAGADRQPPDLIPDRWIKL